ncbi:hypothetical protein [Haloarcula nitratireducens]|uniref:Uncharacterized protein n=1 Tax=Haloarcula nitratireducens TaxID=2487749 RepID=A0AAW4PGG6_9EURY|nr:hypothetical protein [Halomicroarcula nitratireducens]MBX0296713.1 hypothetical protein [Halomicroarcula nitratireducens]
MPVSSPAVVLATLGRPSRAVTAHGPFLARADRCIEVDEVFWERCESRLM